MVVGTGERRLSSMSEMCTWEGRCVEACVRVKVCVGVREGVCVSVGLWVPEYDDEDARGWEGVSSKGG